MASVGYYQQQPGMQYAGQPQQTTTVVVQQPQTIVLNSREWAHGICGCCEDLGECTSRSLCPCISRAVFVRFSLGGQSFDWL